MAEWCEALNAKGEEERERVLGGVSSSLSEGMLGSSFLQVEICACVRTIGVIF